MKKYIIELIGTFILALVVSLSVGGGVFSLSIPILVSLSFCFLIYTFQNISGSHFNPAVTIGFLATKRISTKNGIAYLLSQFLGGFLALLVAGFFGFKANLLPTSSSIMTLIAEIFGAFIFAFGIGFINSNKNVLSNNGFVGGLSLLIGISIAGLLGSYGILNPSIALSAGIFDLFYFVGPIIGFTLGIMFYFWITEKNEVEIINQNNLQ